LPCFFLLAAFLFLGRERPGLLPSFFTFFLFFQFSFLLFVRNRIPLGQKSAPKIFLKKKKKERRTKN
jgi:hypothetical protein